jgi:hypothetical protein
MEKSGQWYPLAVISWIFQWIGTWMNAKTNVEGFTYEPLPVIRTGFLVCSQLLPCLIIWS